MTPSRASPSPTWPWIHIGAAFAIVAAAAVILRSIGRTAFCTCGTISVWTADAWGPENSQQLFDPYTFTHVTHGVLLYALVRIVAGGLSLPTRGVLVVLIESAWEILENTERVIERYRAETMALGYYGDSIFNSVGDILACMVGVVLAARLPVRSTMTLVIGMEVVLTVWIRDSLALNVLMLLYPIEAVKRWQLGAC